MTSRKRKISSLKQKPIDNFVNKRLKTTDTYKRNYDSYIKIGQELMKKQILPMDFSNVINHDYDVTRNKRMDKVYKLKTDNLTTSFGTCDYTNNCISISNFFLSNKNCNSESIKNLLLHEIAHAHTLNYSKTPHGPEFKKKLKELGGNDKYYNKNHFMNTENSRYKLECPKGCVYYRQNFPKYVNLACINHKLVYFVTNNYENFVTNIKEESSIKQLFFKFRNSFTQSIDFTLTRINSFFGIYDSSL
jgi:hypothetical protein